MLRICIIGAGNISNTRHIPAVLKNRNLDLVGVISDEQKKIDRTLKTYSKIANTFLISSHDSNVIQELESCEWFIKNIDAVIIGVPPHEHFSITKACLLLGKHVLVEKPMMMTVEQCREVNDLANNNHLILNVMHSFQFADNFLKMERRFLRGEFGKLESIFEVQLTNRNRRLPSWYNCLPLGLFYDEAAHFFYSAFQFGNGDLTVLNAHAQYGKVKENTPKFLEIQLLAGEIPVQMVMNFNAPICEWGIMLICGKNFVLYDYFKDILIVIDNDNLHLAKNVLKVSLQFFFSFWKGFIVNGFKMVTNRLLYGHDRTIESFVSSIESGNVNEKISGILGQKVVKAMNEVVILIDNEGKHS